MFAALIICPDFIDLIALLFIIIEYYTIHSTSQIFHSSFQMSQLITEYCYRYIGIHTHMFIFSLDFFRECILAGNKVIISLSAAIYSTEPYEYHSIILF